MDFLTFLIELFWTLLPEYAPAWEYNDELQMPNSVGMGINVQYKRLGILRDILMELFWTLMRGA